MEIEKLLNTMKVKGYTVFPGKYNVNLIGVRSSDKTPNVFNDKIYVLFEGDKGLELHEFVCTTEPGTYWLNNPLNVKGTAVLPPGQYKRTWQLGLHKGYEALVQVAPISVWRDKNKDNLAEEGQLDKGLFGINIHRANPKITSKQVDKWSAGCQVLADPIAYEQFLRFCRRSAEIYGNIFTYTLLKEEEIK